MVAPRRDPWSDVATLTKLSNELAQFAAADAAPDAVVSRVRELVRELEKERGGAPATVRRQLAERWGMSTAHLSRVLQGKRGLSMGAVARICDDLNLAPRYFFTDTGGYREFVLRRAEHALEEGAPVALGAALLAAEAVFEAALRAPPHLAGAAQRLAGTVMRIDFVQTAYALLHTDDAKRQRELGLQLAQQVRSAVTDDGDVLERAGPVYVDRTAAGLPLGHRSTAPTGRQTTFWSEIESEEDDAT